MKKFEFSKEIDRDGKEKVVISDKSQTRLDLIPRIVCVIIALIIWIYCVNMNENNVVTTFTVKLNVVGAESMEHGLHIYGIENITEVKMTVQGTNRDINKYGASDYSAYIDVSQIDEVGWNNVKIITNIPKDSSISLISVDNDTVHVFADESGEVMVPLEVNKGMDFTIQPLYNITYKLEGAEIVNGVECIAVNGPKTIIEEISKAEYLLSGEFMTSKEISGFAINFYNKNGEVVNASNINSIEPNVITYNTTGMKINVDVTTEKLLSVNISPADPLLNFDYFAEPASITVIGDPELLKNIDAYTIKVNETETGIYTYTVTSEDLAQQGLVLKAGEENIVVTVKERVTVTPDE